MSDDLEDFLRREFAARVEHAPGSGDDLADAAIGGARRIRKRRRIAAGAGGVTAVVLAAAMVMWSPLNGFGDKNGPPVASDVTVEEAQSEFDIEFVAERGGEYGVINTENDFVPLGVANEPLVVDRIESGYLVYDDADQLTFSDLDGAEQLRLTDDTGPIDYHTIRPDGDAFATSLLLSETDREMVSVYSGDFSSGYSVTGFEVSPLLTISNWTDDYVVFDASMATDFGANSGSQWYLNDNFDLGLETVGAAGFEAAVVADYESDYICVSDLTPGEMSAPAEQCGNLSDDGTQEMAMSLTGDDQADERITAGGAEDMELVEAGDQAASAEELYEELDIWEMQGFYNDPQGRWEIHFNPRDDQWVLLEISEDGELTHSELTPPDGALFPVTSYI